MIRRATLEDAGAIAALFHDTVRFVNCHDYTPAQIAAWAGSTPDPEKWRARQATGTAYVVEHAGIVVGFAEFRTDGHIDAMYVHRRHQGEGIGSALLAHIEEEARQLNINGLFAEVSVTARRFFARRGFAEVGVQEVEYRGCLFKNYRMTKQKDRISEPGAVPPERDSGDIG